MQYVNNKPSRVYKYIKRDVEIDSAATSRGQRKLTYFVYFPRPPAAAALSIFNVSLCCKVCRRSIEKKETDFIAKS